MPSLPFTDSPLAFAAIQAALGAGQILQKGFGSQHTISTKSNDLDIVTIFDKTAEDYIISFIKTQFPNHSFLAEESGACDTTDASVCWVIDPLDGTLNFAHHIPLFGVSIAAVVNDAVEVGVIYLPMLNELFVAQRGRGSYLNGMQMHVSDINDMHYAVGSTGFPYGDNKLRDVSIEQFKDFLHIGNPIRIIGSAALNLAYVAAGRFDIYWGTNLQPWDIAAGILLVEEAGGKVTHFDGNSHNIFNDPSIIASNSHLHQVVLNLLK